jgi:serine/threonine protein kinase
MRLCRYIAPEYIDKGEISFKSDIFSFGIILIKLLTGNIKHDYENIRSIYLKFF